ncbi:MAG: hypothetical protein LBI77_03070 [Puniceicoccales bacterium]|jgi:hypothetical protein|nr:hypothetical protein [Puniceicoccales bacterium]
MNNRIDLGNGSPPGFSGANGSEKKNQINANLHFKNGKNFTIHIKMKDGEKPIGMQSRFSDFFTLKTKTMKKLAERKTFSPAKARAAMKGIAKYFTKNCQRKNAEKTNAIEETFRKSVTEKKVDDEIIKSLQESYGPEKLEEMQKEKDKKIFSKENLEDWSNLMVEILKKAGNDPYVSISSENQNSVANFKIKAENSHTTLPDPPSKDEILKSAKTLKKELIKELDKLSPGNGEKLFKKYYPKALSDNDAWKPFQKNIKLFTKNGDQKNFTAFLEPANGMGCFSYLAKPEEPKDPEKPKGVSSMERLVPHAMNLWETKISTNSDENQSSSQDKLLFRGIRHGSTGGNEDASKEIITACLVQKLGGINVLEDSMKENNTQEENGSKEKPFSLTMSNIQLMTAGISGDGDMPKNQMETFQKLAKESPLELQIPTPGGKPVYVKFEYIGFNYGVNLQQFHLPPTVVKNLTKENAAAMEIFLGNSKSIAEKNFHPKTFEDIDLEQEKELFGDSEVGKFLNSGASDAEKKIVVQLAHQIADILESGKYKTDESEPYALPARLVLLSEKLGLSTTYNCKSGKDRTGIASIEINHLATEIEMNGGIVPEPYHPLDDREKFNLNEIKNESGSGEITKINTGWEGFKIKDAMLSVKNIFKGVKNRMGDVRGASSLVKGG